MDKVTILGVPVHSVNLKEAAEIITKKARETSNTPFHVITVNPEFIVTAVHDNKFKDILVNADLSLPDGVGVLLAAHLKGIKMKGRVTGVDLVEKLVQESEKGGFRIMFLGGKTGVANRAEECLRAKYSNSNITSIAGPQHIEQSSEKEMEELRTEINQASPDIICVAFGHPKQELWINANKNRLNAKVFIGVGGAFDYISKNVTRAPGVVRQFGLEWLFRLMREPFRFKRQLRLIEFVARVLTTKEPR